MNYKALLIIEAFIMIFLLFPVIDAWAYVYAIIVTHLITIVMVITHDRIGWRQRNE